MRVLLLCLLPALALALGCSAGDPPPEDPTATPALAATAVAAAAPILPPTKETVVPTVHPALRELLPTPTAAPSPTPSAAPAPEPSPIRDLVPSPTPGRGTEAPAEATATPTSVPPQAGLGRVVFGVSAPAHEFSVTRHGGYRESIQHRPEYEHLVASDPATGQTVPELAAEWSLEPDGLSFRFKLRKGVRFHRGWGEFTAKDVVHTHAQLSRQDSRHPNAHTWWPDIITVVEVNDYEVLFRLSRPVPDFFSSLGDQRSLLPIQSKAHFDAEGEPTDPESLFIAGTGPYQLQERSFRSYMRFERPPETHWRVTPDFHEFEFRFQSDSSVRLAALLAGEIHLTHLPFALQSQASQRGMRSARGPAPVMGTWVNVSCCWTDPETGEYPARPESPLTNVLVRKALSKAFDRAALNDAFFDDKAEIMHLAHWHPTRLGWNPAWETDFPEQYGYDPAAARDLLAEAGFDGDNRLETTIELLDLSHYPYARDVAEGISGYMYDTGIRMSLLTRIPASRDAAREAMEDDNLLYLAASSSDQYRGFPVSTTPIYSATNANNDPAMTEITRTILRTPDLDRQAGLWRELGDMAYGSYLTLPLFWFHAEAAYDPEVVSGYTFLGSLGGTWTHVHTIKAAG